jgi:hypothetical protein
VEEGRRWRRREAAVAMGSAGGTRQINEDGGGEVKVLGCRGGAASVACSYGGTWTGSKEGGAEGCPRCARKRKRGKGVAVTQRPLFKAARRGFDGGGRSGQGTRKGHTMRRGGGGGPVVTVRGGDKGAWPGTDPGAAEAGGAPCGNRGGGRRG